MQTTSVSTRVENCMTWQSPNLLLHFWGHLSNVPSADGRAAVNHVQATPVADFRNICVCKNVRSLYSCCPRQLRQAATYRLPHQNLQHCLCCLYHGIHTKEKTNTSDDFMYNMTGLHRPQAGEHEQEEVHGKRLLCIYEKVIVKGEQLLLSLHSRSYSMHFVSINTVASTRWHCHLVDRQLSYRKVYGLTIWWSDQAWPQLQCQGLPNREQLQLGFAQACD